MAKPLPRGIDLLPSGGYRGRFYRDGVRYSTDVCRTVTEAKDALARLRADVTRGEWVQSRGGVTLDEWFAAWNPTRDVRTTTKAEDQRRYELHISPHLGRRALRTITPDLLAHFQAQLELSAATKRKVWALLSACLGRRGALRAGLVRANPCASVPAPRAQRQAVVPLTREQVAAILAGSPEYYRVVVLAAALTGLRWSELVGLAVEDWHRDQGVLHVQRAARERAGRFTLTATKGNAARLVPVHPDLAAALKEHVGARTTGPLLTTPSGQPLRHSNFRRDVWLPALKQAGVTARWHDLRHTFATWLFEGEADAATVRDLLGHASIQTTQVYAHTVDSRRRNAVEALQGLALPGEQVHDQ